MPLKMNLSLYSPHARLGRHVKGSSHCKKLPYQGKLCQNFVLTFEEFNRVTHNASAKHCLSRPPVALPFLPVHGPFLASKTQPGPVRTSNRQPSPAFSQEHNSMQTIINLSILTPAAMMRLSSVAKRPVQQAVVAKGYNGTCGYQGLQLIYVIVCLLSSYINGNAASS